MIQKGILPRYFDIRERLLKTHRGSNFANSTENYNKLVEYIYYIVVNLIIALEIFLIFYIKLMMELIVVLQEIAKKHIATFLNENKSATFDFELLKSIPCKVDWLYDNKQ